MLSVYSYPIDLCCYGVHKKAHQSHPKTLCTFENLHKYTHLQALNLRHCYSD